MQETETYVLFEDGPFSQGYLAPMIIDGIEFNCCEQWVMYKQARIFKDYDTAMEILSTPMQRKVQIRGFNLYVWDEEALAVVQRGVLEKFRQNPELYAMLMATGKKGVAACTPHDTLWGNGLTLEAAANIPSSEWPGKNLLGRVLDGVRKIFSVEEAKRKLG